MTMTRRDWLRSSSAAFLSVPVVELLSASPAHAAEWPFQLPKLPYAYDALEPVIDARTMEIHHDRHHAGYVRKLNAALEGKPELQKMTLVELLTGVNQLPEEVRTAVRNNGGGNYNHSLFWEVMQKNGGQPKGELKKAINDTFSSVEAMLEIFQKAAIGQFGSGWGWLTVGPNGKLSIISTPNQDNSLMFMVGRQIPLMGIDVWEHAYYLKYQNKRADYVQKWCSIIHWDMVSDRYNKILKELKG